MAVVLVIGLAVGWGNARKSSSDYYRPAADAASRIGDARFLNIRHAIESGPSGRGTR